MHWTVQFGKRFAHAPRGYTEHTAAFVFGIDESEKVRDKRRVPSTNKESNVRRIQANEGQALRTIRLAALADSPSAFGSSLERELGFDDALWASRAQQAASGSAAGTFIAVADGRLVGLVTILGPEHEAAPTSTNTELVSMWIDPAARRRGLGALLMEAAVEFSRTMRAQAIELSVTHDNLAARALYLQHGFTRIAPTQESQPCMETMRLRLQLTS